MSRGQKRAVAGASVLAALLIAAALWARGPWRPAPLARLEAVSGAVSLGRGERQPRPAARGLALQVGDVLTTGAAAGAEVRFAGGHRVELGADTQVVVTAAGVAELDGGLMLSQGQLRAHFLAGLGELVIETPLGRLHSGHQGGELTVGAVEGISVAAGEITLVRDNAVSRLAAGRHLGVDGVELALGGDGRPPPPPPPAAAPAPAAADETAPISLRVVPEPAVWIRRGPADRWRQVTEAAQVEGGAEVHARGPRQRATLQFGPGQQVSLAPGGHLVLAHGPAAQPGWALVAGQAQVRLLRQDARSPAHHVGVHGRAYRLSPGLRQADIDLDAGPSGGAGGDARVHLGRLDGPQVAAGPGERIPLPTGTAPAAPARPLTAARIEARLGTAMRVAYLDAPPALELSWEELGSTTGPRRVEVAEDSAFTRLLGAEAVEGRQLLWDRVPAPGRLWWRVLPGPEAGTEVQMVAETSMDCRHCQPSSEVTADGGHTTVLYQQQLPEIALVAPLRPGARDYLFTLAREPAAAQAPWRQASRRPRVVVPGGVVEEGEMRWQVVARGPGQHALAPAVSSRLSLKFDSGVRTLHLRSPRRHLRTEAGEVEVAGELGEGLSLRVQGQPVEAGADRRFRRAVPLSAGLNMVVLRVTGSDLPEQVWVRRVERRQGS